MLQSWFKEQKDTTTSNIKRFAGENKFKIGHFTAMVTDRTTHVGCAMSKFMMGQWQALLLVCNYSSSNIIFKPVYNVGALTEKCLSGRNPLFPGLCSANEL